MQHKLKINNSYESEPSSCSVSPSSDGISCEGKDSVEETTVPKLSKFVMPSTSDGNINLKVTKNPIKFKIFDMEANCSENSKLNIKNEKVNTEYCQQLVSHDFNFSQEPDFEGFASETSVKHYEFFPQCEEEENDIENSPSPGRLLIDEGTLSPSICHLNDNNSRNVQKISDISKLTTKKNTDVEKVLLIENNKLDMNERSPDMFDFYDEIDDAVAKTEYANIDNELNAEEPEDILTSATQSNEGRELLKRIKDCLSGVPPPPSITISQIDVLNAVVANKENILNFYNQFKELSAENSNNQQESFSTLFKPIQTLEEVKKMTWPEILTAKQHGLCYNLSTVREKIELLSLSVVERYIGVETSSSFQAFSLNSRRTSSRLRMTVQSPGSRLSHLAKRRAAFSSATLQSAFQKQIPKTIASRQILIDSKKSDNRRKSKVKTPKRRTPGKTKMIKKPSSANKGQKENELKPGPTRETSKRALFQSPPEIVKPIIVPKPTIKPEIANRVEKSKRALFSPEKPLNTKRKRENEDDNSNSNPSKMFRTDFENLTPRSLKFKSQSFCIGAGTSNDANNPFNSVKGKTLTRASSDTVCSSQLTESHRKKLLWAVSQALQTKHIGVDHPKFKQYAAVLARAIKRLFLEFYLNIRSNSTSDTMLRLSKKYVHCALLNMTADDIYLSERNRLEQEKQFITKKFSRYVPPDDSENVRGQKLKKIPSSLFSENSCDSFNLLSQNCTQNSQYSEFLSQISQDSLLSKSNSTIAIKLQNIDNNKISSSSSLQNSSSKSNLHSVALRENVDSEQRKSAQKNFTGKDMKNTSPYIENIRSELKLRNVATNNQSSEKNAVRAKRQISFDN